MLTIKRAEKNDFKEVQHFYYSLIDGIQNTKYKPGWKKDVYPTAQFLQESINDQELYIGILNERIIAAMVVNHKCNEGYIKVTWICEGNGWKSTFTGKAE